MCDTWGVKYRLSICLAGGVLISIFQSAVCLGTAGSSPQDSRAEQKPEEKNEAGPSKSKVRLARLRIESTPPAAKITLRGAKQPLKTPAEFNLLPGDYAVTLSLDCYSSVSTTLHLEAEDDRLLTRELTPLPCNLAVRSVPSGARIIVEGVLRNQTTPATISAIGPGETTVSVQLPGYRSQRMTVKATCGETVAADFGDLQKVTAQIAITSNVQGAAIWIDGADSAQKTPCSLEIPLGTHKIKLIAPRGYRSEEKNVLVQDDENLRLHLDLKEASITGPTNSLSSSRSLGESHN